MSRVLTCHIFEKITERSDLFSVLEAYSMQQMFVVKRDGRRVPVMFDKVTARLNKLSYGLDKSVVPTFVAQKVIQGIYDGVATAELDELASETAAYMSTQHPDYSKFAARIAVSNLHKLTNKQFSVVMSTLYMHKKGLEGAPLISEETFRISQTHAECLDAVIVHDRDFEYDYFGLKTLLRSYLLRVDGAIVERPQQMLMRIAIGIHGDDKERILETYSLMSQGWFTHATPTMFNAGTPHPQMSSCFLLQMQDDSIEGIFETLKRCAKISKGAGGIGLSVTNIRASGSYIRGSGGNSNGLLPMLRVYDNTARYVDQGGGKRKGGFAIYLEPWHADVFQFLELKKNHGKEEARARDLFYALWIPDLFMQRVEANGKWSLMCPDECPGLCDKWGAAFEELYTRYEDEGRARETVDAQKLWFAILDSQIETGTPYMLYKDAANRKSNHQHLGTIRSSNLCTEIIEYTAKDEVAVCNLASIALPKMVVDGGFEFERLVHVVRVLVYNLNRVIDRNFYPVEEAKLSNMKHRPIGVGVQGLADVFMLLKIPYDSAEARVLNREIFETIYYAALCASCELAERDGHYQSYEGSPVSQGILQFDMWEQTPSDRWDWKALRESIAVHGLRNSLLVAPMPTASTAQILGNNECFEPYTSNIYSRRVLAGEFAVVNHHLLRDLCAHGSWNDDIRQKIIAHNGSVQALEIPEDLKKLYKTSWELKMKPLIDMAADRGAFIDQSQSFNVFMSNPSYDTLSSMHFYGWKSGLKTGMYYLRTQGASEALKFTVSEDTRDDAAVCTRGGDCTSCGA